VILAATLAALALSLGGPTVPDVTGLARSQAQCAIADAGLRWRDAGEPSSHARATVCDPGEGVAPDPRVIRQRPAAGRRVPRGTPVVLHTRCTRRRPCL
jgi:beta-lactam-binding protein with PASTA domain